MNYVNTIVWGFAALALFAYLERRMAFPVLPRTETTAGAEPESPEEPPKEENPPRRDPDYYYQATTVVLRVCFLHLVSYRDMLTTRV